MARQKITESALFALFVDGRGKPVFVDLETVGVQVQQLALELALLKQEQDDLKTMTETRGKGERYQGPTFRGFPTDW